MKKYELAILKKLGFFESATLKKKIKKHRFYPQNGICLQKYNFWPNNDGEKWSRKNIFEIPPCGRLLSLTSKVPKITNSVIKITMFPHGGISKKNSRAFLGTGGQTALLLKEGCNSWAEWQTFCLL